MWRLRDWWCGEEGLGVARKGDLTMQHRSLFHLWLAMLYRRIFYPNATIWVRGEDGKWYNADDMTEVYKRHK